MFIEFEYFFGVFWLLDRIELVGWHQSTKPVRYPINSFILPIQWALMGKFAEQQHVYRDFLGLKMVGARRCGRWTRNSLKITYLKKLKNKSVKINFILF